jgi:glycosyltransferase involved in cell wall biosynthesis
MRFLIITHVLHKKEQAQYFAYSPYIREMNVWLKHVDQVTVIAPVINTPHDAIDIAYCHDNLKFVPVKQLSFTSVRNALRSALYLPGIVFRMIVAMRKADHIHLRCPGNMGLIGCFVQMLFPWKIKTAKYAGNWDFSSKQPFTYRLQQKLLRNTILSKNMTALVYGDWPGGTKNIKPFFTASYHTTEQETITPRKFDDVVRLIFVGTLTNSKQPMISARVCHALRMQHINTELHIYGEGEERNVLERFISDHALQNYIFLHGNQPSNIVKQAFRKSHFLVFISRSEGWPKAVAEAMWWGCLPVTTAVSCTPEMLGYGKRGELVSHSVNDICNVIEANIDNPDHYTQKCREAMDWARNYTVEMFESEIKKMII